MRVKFAKKYFHTKAISKGTLRQSTRKRSLMSVKFAKNRFSDSFFRLGRGLPLCVFGDCFSVKIFLGKSHTHEASLWGGMMLCVFGGCLSVKIFLDKILTHKASPWDGLPWCGLGEIQPTCQLKKVAYSRTFSFTWTGLIWLHDVTVNIAPRCSNVAKSIERRPCAHI